MAKAVAAQVYDPIGAYGAVVLVYLVMVFALNELLKFLELRAHTPGFDTERKFFDLK